MATDLEELRRVGDTMQSSLSRLIAYMERHDHLLPYETRMASLEGKTAIDQWTDIRRKSEVS